MIYDLAKTVVFAIKIYMINIVKLLVLVINI
jgi:hypothetical protein